MSENKERDLIAPRPQAPASASQKDAASRADLARQLCILGSFGELAGLVDDSVAFVCRKSSYVWIRKFL
jgi:hypothetical protein